MIVITAPTGTIGQQVLERVLKSDVPIRVIARDPSRLPAPTREQVEVVQGSHGDIDVVNRAFTGADTVFWLVPPDPHAKSVDAAYVDFARPACDALKSRGVKRVVDITPLDAVTNPACAATGNPRMAQGTTDMADAKNKGLDNAEPRTGQNTTPTGFRQWCEEALKPAILN